jgi:3-oxoadipate enol-lactonase
MTTVHILDPYPQGSPPVLLLHGMGATGQSWSLQFPALIRAGYRPLAPDVPGFGDSPYDDKGWSITRAANDIINSLEEIGSGAAHITGLSMGGVIAQQIAHDHPYMTRKLVLVSTFSRLRPDNLTEWYYFLRRIFALSVRGLPAQAEVVAKRVFPLPEQAFLRDLLRETITHSNQHAYRKAMVALGCFDSRKWLGTLTQPTLVVTGSVDTTVSPKLQKKLATQIPGAKHIILKDSGHAVPVDHADQFNQILLDFLT